MSAPRPGYRLLEHTADIGFEVEAADWPGLLAAATAALGDLVLADDGSSATETRDACVEGADREDVLVAWLTEAVVLYEREGFVSRGARIRTATATRAEGALIGRRTDPAREPPDRVVKAVTYHGLKVREGGPGTPWSATLVLDL